MCMCKLVAMRNLSKIAACVLNTTIALKGLVLDMLIHVPLEISVLLEAVPLFYVHQVSTAET